MSVKLLSEHHFEFLSLKGGCTGSSESTLVKMPQCWKSHVSAQIVVFMKHRAPTICLSMRMLSVLMQLDYCLLLLLKCVIVLGLYIWSLLCDVDRTVV